MTYVHENKGFTLVELAIVIVIIGFLVSGIAVGANMIRQAELRSVITDLQLHQVAYNNFIGRFNKVPGDMDNASSFWTATSGTFSGAATGAFRSVDATDAALSGDCATGAGATNYTIATTYSACVIGLSVN